MSNQTVDCMLSSLGYSNPMDAARQQARMMLLGRFSRFQAIIQQIESRSTVSFEKMYESYLAQGNENWEQDEDFLEWQWYRDAIETIKGQLTILALPIAE